MIDASTIRSRIGPINGSSLEILVGVFITQGNKFLMTTMRGSVELEPWVGEIYGKCHIRATIVPYHMTHGIKGHMDAMWQ
jgi:hypothetical protein